MNKFSVGDLTQEGLVVGCYAFQMPVSYTVLLSKPRKYPPKEWYEGKVKEQYLDVFFEERSKVMLSVSFEEHELSLVRETHIPQSKLGAFNKNGDQLLGIQRGDIYIDSHPACVHWTQENPECFSVDSLVFGLKFAEPVRTMSLEQWIKGYPMYTEEYAEELWLQQPTVEYMWVMHPFEEVCEVE